MGCCKGISTFPLFLCSKHVLLIILLLHIIITQRNSKSIILMPFSLLMSCLLYFPITYVSSFLFFTHLCIKIRQTYFDMLSLCLECFLIFVSLTSIKEHKVNSSLPFYILQGHNISCTLSEIIFNG